MYIAVVYFAKAVALALGILSIVLHEVAHGYAAYRLGDPTAFQRGRLTLNPIKHVDPFMTLLLPLLLFFSTQGRFIFGGAKPVPVNPYLFKNMRKGMAITGIAGPLVNITVAVVCGLILRTSEVLGGILSDPLVYIFASVGLWNMLLAAFNLVPIPPLDGSRVAVYLMPRDWAHRYERLERFGLLLVVIVLMTGILNPVFDCAVKAFIFVAGQGWLVAYYKLA